MTKDGMKDKISMALKDPILQMGFEVICSKLSRLEKENAELKAKNCWKTCEYAEPKSQWISQHIQDIERLTKAKEKWHDLQKDPNDVPNDNRYVWTNVGAGYHDDDGWWDDFGRLHGVIAWCEPEFEADEQLTLPKDILGLWEQTVCEIRSEIKAQDTPALVYAKELCDKLEHSMCAVAGGPYNLRYSITD